MVTPEKDGFPLPFFRLGQWVSVASHSRDLGPFLRIR